MPHRARREALPPLRPPPGRRLCPGPLPSPPGRVTVPPGPEAEPPLLPPLHRAAGVERAFIRQAVAVQVVPDDPATRLGREAVLEPREARVTAGVAARQVDEEGNQPVAHLARLVGEPSVAR
eukprot:scaffold22677_cov105-Isochrysis_galbana.AAC.4